MFLKYFFEKVDFEKSQQWGGGGGGLSLYLQKKASKVNRSLDIFDKILIFIFV